MPGMEMARLDPHDDAQVEDYFRLWATVHAADRPDDPPPLRESFVATMRQEHSEMALRLHAARDGGRMVGGALLAMPTIDNRHLAQVDVWVHPEQRRRGAGRALMRRLLQDAKENGRTSVMARAIGRVPGGPPRGEAGSRYLEAMGFAPALTLTQRRLDLSALDEAAEEALWRECQPHTAGYEIVSWTGLTPDRWAPGVAHLRNRLVSDAPRGELDIDETTMDAQRQHAEDREWLDLGRHLVGVAAVHQASGEVAALTRVDVRPPGDHGDLWLTIVAPAHRGHRLGTVVKIEVHRRVRALFPDFGYVLTGNADVNAHMLAINERLGYRAYATATNYQRRLE